jgi:hypothetical protein
MVKSDSTLLSEQDRLTYHQVQSDYRGNPVHEIHFIAVGDLVAVYVVVG